MASCQGSSDYKASAREVLISQYQNSPNLINHYELLLTQLEDAQDAYCQLLDERSIGTAVGVQLDILGAIVGQPRVVLQGALISDEVYRVLIQGAAIKNHMRSTPEDIIEFLAFILDIPLITVAEFTQRVVVYIGEILTDAQKELVKLEFNTRGFGSPSHFVPRTLGVQYDFAEFDGEDAFIYTTSTGTPLPFGRGYAISSDPLNGGRYAVTI